MRAEYSATLSSVHYLLVEWSSDVMDWAAFRSSVVGAGTSEAPPSSLRGGMAAQWRDLRLQHPLDVTHNAVHASAFEALAERTQWLNAPSFSDPLGYSLNVHPRSWQTGSATRSSMASQSSIISKTWGVKKALKWRISYSFVSLLNHYYLAIFSFISRESASV